jgi:endonuclease/exonuclease/phosphatase family metal-dependent hydrolase
MRVLTWNLFHGRAVPDRRGSLLNAFAQRLAGWDWDVALLQEVPPWWGPPLGRAARASARTALTSRNWLLPLRRIIGERHAGLLGSWGGGANVILVRPSAGAIAEHRRRTLRLVPERRVVHAVRLGDGTWIANVHGQGHGEHRAQRDLALSGQALKAWAGAAPAILGGDVNTFRPVDPPGLVRIGGHRVDHVFAHGFRAADQRRRATMPARGGLSDHAAVLVDLVREDGAGPGVPRDDDTIPRRTTS